MEKEVVFYELPEPTALYSAGTQILIHYIGSQMFGNHATEPVPLYVVVLKEYPGDYMGKQISFKPVPYSLAEKEAQRLKEEFEAILNCKPERDSR